MTHAVMVFKGNIARQLSMHAGITLTIKDNEAVEGAEEAAGNEVGVGTGAGTGEGEVRL